MNKVSTSKHTKKGKQHTSSANSNSNRLKWLMAICLLTIIIISTLFFLPLAPKTATITIPENISQDSLHNILQARLGKGQALRITIMQHLSGKKILSHPKQITIKKGTPPALSFFYLIRASRTPVKLVINGFRTRNDILNYIHKKTGAPTKAIDSLLHDTNWLNKYNLTPANANAIFLNYTHEFYYGETPENIMQKIGEAYQKFWTPQRKGKAYELGLTPASAITLASIVEEESNVRSERGTIGQLYLNRLHKGMRLQADPTIKFAIGDFSIKRITHNMLNTESPYNTYRNSGLPPGPIRTVDPATIDAILQNKPVDYLYMCAKPDFSGAHNFTSNYSTHLRNAEAYRKALDSLNIK